MGGGARKNVTEENVPLSWPPPSITNCFIPWGHTSRNYSLLSSHLANGRTFIAWSINEGTFWPFETWWEAEYFLSVGTNGPMMRAEHYIL